MGGGVDQQQPNGGSLGLFGLHPSCHSGPESYTPSSLIFDVVSGEDALSVIGFCSRSGTWAGRRERVGE